MYRIEKVRITPRGLLCGESNPAARHPDHIVQRARQLHADLGLGRVRIGHLLGISQWTVKAWLAGTRRRAFPLKIRTRKVWRDE